MKTKMLVFTLLVVCTVAMMAYAEGFTRYMIGGAMGLVSLLAYIAELFKTNLIELLRKQWRVFWPEKKQISKFWPKKLNIKRKGEREWRNIRYSQYSLEDLNKLILQFEDQLLRTLFVDKEVVLEKYADVCGLIEIKETEKEAAKAVLLQKKISASVHLHGHSRLIVTG
jgi:hypothetical protein